MLRDNEVGVAGRQPGHLSNTAAKGTTHPEDQDCSSLRFPGYLGRDFEPGAGVLVIYNVHREFHSWRLVSDPSGVITDFIEASSHLQNAHEPDDDQLAEYITAHRPMYEVGLSGGWKVADHLLAALPPCDVPITREGLRKIAYVNVSCAQFPELHPEPGDDRRKSNLKALCSARHPVSQVVDLLRPAIVLCASAVGSKTILGAGARGTLAWTQQVISGERRR